MAATGGKWASMGFSTIHENALLHQVFTLLRSQKGVDPKTADTDAIFENVREVNSDANADPATLRISMDTIATVPVGEYSRGGQSRVHESVKTLDHDMSPKEKLVPGGVLEPVSSWIRRSS